MCRRELEAAERRAVSYLIRVPRDEGRRNYEEEEVWLLPRQLALVDAAMEEGRYLRMAGFSGRSPAVNFRKVRKKREKKKKGP